MLSQQNFTVFLWKEIQSWHSKHIRYLEKKWGNAKSNSNTLLSNQHQKKNAIRWSANRRHGRKELNHYTNNIKSEKKTCTLILLFNPKTFTLREVYHLIIFNGISHDLKDNQRCKLIYFPSLKWAAQLIAHVRIAVINKSARPGYVRISNQYVTGNQDECNGTAAQSTLLQ